MASPLENAIIFLRDFGLFDIVLPFLLVFTIVFAILEKTKILGEEDGKPKKNLNSMVAFVVGLLVVATNKIVNALTQALPNVILLVIISISFLLLIGVFWKTGEMDFRTEHKGLYGVFVAFFLIAIILIFLGSIEKGVSGESWLKFFYDYVALNWGGSVVSSFIFLLVVIFAIYFVTKGGHSKAGGD